MSNYWFSDDRHLQQQLGIAVGTVIGSIRRRAGFSMQRLGLLSSVHKSYPQKVERGAKTPGLDVFLSFCTTLRSQPELVAQDALSLVNRCHCLTLEQTRLLCSNSHHLFLAYPLPDSFPRARILKQTTAKAFATTLNSIRGRQALGRLALERQAHMSRGYLARILSAERGVSLGLAFDIAQALGVTGPALIAQTYALICNQTRYNSQGADLCIQTNVDAKE